MCGIVGLFAKNISIKTRLGTLISDMLEVMTDRGPDSAGVAIYKNNKLQSIKLTLYSSRPKEDFVNLKRFLASKKIKISMETVFSSAVLYVSKVHIEKVIDTLAVNFPSIRLVSKGKKIEIYKDVGKPKTIVDNFNLRKMSGTHAIGHTRMATESAVTTLGAHPFSTGYDQCLVHNGSLSNHNSLRRELIRKNMDFETENDSEVAASYLTEKMDNGADLGQALKHSVKDFDGFYTFVVGTADGFGVLRDPIACKPAVLAETKDYVAFGSEYRALASLPDIEKAKVWEPEPGIVYFWDQNNG